MKKQKTKLFSILFVFFLISLVGGVVLLLHPRTSSMIEWQWIKAKVYVRGIIDPVEAVPTAKIVHTSTPPVLPTATQMPPTATINSSTPTMIPTATPTPLPEIVTLAFDAYEKQDMNNCGPATLSMYLQYYGWDGDQFDVFDWTKTERADRNVNIQELDHFVRMNAGWLVTLHRVGGTLDLLKEFIAAEIPVVTENSFYFEEEYYANDDRWAGHYQFLTGYDDTTQTFTIQDSIKGGNRTVPYDEFLKKWQSFNYLFMLVYHPNDEALVTEILGDYNSENRSREIASAIALQEIEANPEDVFAWFNLATNQSYFEDYATAADSYDQARAIGWPQRMLRYQFGPFVTYYRAGRTDDVIELLDYALRITPNSEEAWLWKGWVEYRLGNAQARNDAFLEAYKFNHKSTDVLYALDYFEITPYK